MSKFVKLSLSAIILLSAAMPLFNSSNSESALDTIFSIGVAQTIILFAAFFIAVAFYCLSLQTCLALIAPHNRKAPPASVWYMFLIPFNFIEDFFIMINISQSLEEEARFNSKLSGIKDFGMITGIGWSIAQIISLVPNIAGQIAGAFGLILWIVHWRFIIRINKLLKVN
ncbi:MAG: hypothetical protein EOO43_02575 [Flavobacterium sp.]|nr:MAG: hypothetical protein EOO43_02575 [Flavobacterium sp.]